MDESGELKEVKREHNYDTFCGQIFASVADDNVVKLLFVCIFCNKDVCTATEFEEHLQRVHLSVDCLENAVSLKHLSAENYFAEEEAAANSAETQFADGTLTDSKVIIKEEVEDSCGNDGENVDTSSIYDYNIMRILDNDAESQSQSPVTTIKTELEDDIEILSERAGQLSQSDSPVTTIKTEEDDDADSVNEDDVIANDWETEMDAWGYTPHIIPVASVAEAEDDSALAGSSSSGPRLKFVNGGASSTKSLADEDSCDVDKEGIYYYGSTRQITNPHDLKRERCRLELIKMYEKFPCLWDLNSEQHDFPNLRDMAYKFLFRKYREYFPSETDIRVLKEKVNSMRRNASKECERYMIAKQNNMEFVPKYKLFNEFKFLMEDSCDVKEETFKCAFCPKISDSAPNLTYHYERSHHGNKLYAGEPKGRKRKPISVYPQALSHGTWNREQKVITVSQEQRMDDAQLKRQPERQAERQPIKISIKKEELFPSEKEPEPKVLSISDYQPCGCDICGKQFKRLKDLECHQRIHTGVRPYKCPHCPKSFVRASNLNTHKLYTHMPIELRKYKCEICDRRFPEKRNYTVHMRRHANIRPFKCFECNKDFITQNQLKLHSVVHEQKMPYVCDLCGDGFKIEEHLQGHHESVHTEGRSGLKCALCGKIFALTSDLKEHILTHGSSRSFTCDNCTFEFQSKTTLTTHRKLAVDPKLYSCDICKLSFPQNMSLCTHLKLHCLHNKF